jgi:uncharacterized protein (TIGR00730 family)
VVTVGARTIRRVCVFCGAQPGREPIFVEAATALGAALGRQRIDVIYGGSRNGCMGALADAALAHGGIVVGVLPALLHVSEQRHEAVTECVIVDSLAARKLEMFRRSDAVIILPGGTGTLDELLEAITMKRIGLLQHPVALVNVGGFFASTLTVLDEMVAAGFAEASQRQLFDVLPRVDAVTNWLTSH